MADQSSDAAYAQKQAEQEAQLLQQGYAYREGREVSQAMLGQWQAVVDEIVARQAERAKFPRPVILPPRQARVPVETPETPAVVREEPSMSPMRFNGVVIEPVPHEDVPAPTAAERQLADEATARQWAYGLKDRYHTSEEARLGKAIQQALMHNDMIRTKERVEDVPLLLQQVPRPPS